MFMWAWAERWPIVDNMLTKSTFCRILSTFPPHSTNGDVGMGKMWAPDRFGQNVDVGEDKMLTKHSCGQNVDLGVGKPLTKH